MYNDSVGLEQLNSSATKHKLSESSLWLRNATASRFWQGFAFHQALMKTFISDLGNLDAEETKQESYCGLNFRGH